MARSPAKVLRRPARRSGERASGERAARPVRSLWSRLGAGFITGASDDDPSGVGTYSQAGAQFGYQLAWTLLFTYPMMVVIQEFSARIGRVTGKGIAGNLRQHYPAWILQPIVWLLFAANTLNIGADLGAMAESMRLLVPFLPGWVWIVLFAVVCTVTQVLLSHQVYVGVLKWLTLGLLSYFGVLVVVDVDWGGFLRALIIPHLSLGVSFWLMVVAILGTTISPYLFFWQAAQEVEDTKAHPQRVPLRHKPSQGASALARIRWDTAVGMAFSNTVGLAILVATASTLRQAKITEVQTAAQAAEALRPLAGEFAFALFALGIIGTGLLSVPVLAGSAAYALGEARRWPVGLSRKPLQAKGFYAAITLATVAGALANVSGINPMKALVGAAVINGIVAVPVMVLLMLMSGQRRIMGQFRVSGYWRVTGWLATVIMAVAATVFIAKTFF
ncbi:MAG: divalent metal cation transporter [Gammaproteobacteria bacterium]|nr:divalent metal cation transporter [Gammaproteobacteria bacterium]